MRITAGQYKGRRLETPKNGLIRPTSDKVRQAMFNALHSRGIIHDAIVIDAFCGTGALGIEALSQGARFCTFIDKNRSSLKLCQQNLANLAETRAETLCMDSTKARQRPDDTAAADLIFMDPPYGHNMIPDALESLYRGGWIQENCRFVLEMDKKEELSIDINILNEKLYGDTKIIFAQKTS